MVQERSTAASRPSALNDRSVTAVGMTVIAFENSDVLPKVVHAAPSVQNVAVAVITSPSVPAKV